MKSKKAAGAQAFAHTIGIVGGLGSLAGGDLFYKLVKSRAVLEDQGAFFISCSSNIPSRMCCCLWTQAQA